METLKLAGADETRALVHHYLDRIKVEAERGDLTAIERHIKRIRELNATIPRSFDDF